MQSAPSTLRPARRSSSAPSPRLESACVSSPLPRLSASTPNRLKTSRPFDITIDGDLVQTAEQPAGTETVGFQGLPSGDKTIELWLPQRHGPVRLRSLSVDDGAVVNAVPDPRPKWVTYGSSITHCAQASSPACTWPALAARMQGLNLTCLGYGGNCHIEPMLAHVVRDREADHIALKLGINVMGAASLGPEDLQGGGDRVCSHSKGKARRKPR